MLWLIALFLLAYGLLALRSKVHNAIHLIVLVGLIVLLWQPAPAAVDATSQNVATPAYPALPAAAPANVPANMARWSNEVAAASAQCNIPTERLWAIMDIESDGDPNAESDVAVGLMQVVAREAAALGPRFAWAVDRPTRAELLEPAFNVRWAACYLAELQAGYGEWEGYRRYYGHTDSSTDEWYANTAQALAATYKAEPLAEAVGSSRFTSTPLIPMPPVFKSFGAAVDYQVGGLHTGIDIANPRQNGEEPAIYAVADGEVVHVGPLYCDGATACRGSKAIVIGHGSEIYSIYSHNSAATVVLGQRVGVGEVIGRQGNEGYSLGSHLHFEVHTGSPFTRNWREPWRGGQFEDPQNWLPQRQSNN